MTLPDYLSSRVAVIHQPSLSYPAFPYHPSKSFPEFSKTAELNPANGIYPAIRELLRDLGLDTDRFDTAQWNPFCSLLKPGQTVLFKPNWVRHVNALDPSLDSLITHSAILRPLLDYAALALEGRGTITLADAPLQSCDLSALITKSRIGELLDTYRSRFPDITFQLIDLRKTVLSRQANQEAFGQATQTAQSGDPQGYSLVDLGQDSFLMDIIDRHERFRVTNYDYRLLRAHHTPERNEYLVTNSILDADLVINVPKMKCHIKAGLTGALKNLIGINGHKEYLPHHINGSFFEGGDQYIYRSRLKELYNPLYDHYWAHHREQSAWLNRLSEAKILTLDALSRLFDKESLLDGGWFGNETIPRTTLDLNHILYFYDRKSQAMRDQPVRRVLHIIDGVTAGENRGPLRPQAKAAGVLIGGFNPLFTDLAMARLMGYTPLKVKTLFYGLNHRLSRLNVSSDQSVIYNGASTLPADLPSLDFVIPKFWEQAR